MISIGKAVKIILLTIVLNGLRYMLNRNLDLKYTRWSYYKYIYGRR